MWQQHPQMFHDACVVLLHQFDGAANGGCVCVMHVLPGRLADSFVGVWPTQRVTARLHQVLGVAFSVVMSPHAWSKEASEFETGGHHTSGKG